MFHKRLSAWIQAFRPDVFNYRWFLLAVAFGVAGGVCFSALKLPLPWMLGPMLFSAVAAILGAPVAAPAAARMPMVVVLGAMLGAGVRPELLGQVPQYLLSLTGMVLAVAIGGLCCFFFLRVVAKFDRTTAYFGSVPGGITEMILMGEASGGDTAKIALIHTSRILFVIFFVPFLIQLLSGVSVGQRPSTGVPLLSLPLSEIAIFAATCLLGAIAAGFINSPMSMFLGPLLISGLIHGTGLAAFRTPAELVIMAQLIIGITLGCRLVGTRLGEAWLPMIASLGAYAVVLAIGLTIAFGVSLLSGEDLLVLLLAYVPGGVAEMSLVALALHIDPAFVVLHHVARLLLVVIVASPLFLWLQRSSGPGATP